MASTEGRVGDPAVLAAARAQEAEAQGTMHGLETDSDQGSRGDPGGAGENEGGGARAQGHVDPQRIPHGSGAEAWPEEVRRMMEEMEKTQDMVRTMMKERVSGERDKWDEGRSDGGGRRERDEREWMVLDEKHFRP